MRGRYIRLTLGLLAFLLPGLASATRARAMDCTKPPYGDSQDNYQQFILNGEVASKGDLQRARAIAAAEASELQSACNAKYRHRGVARYATMGLSAAALKNFAVTRIAAYAIAWKNQRPQRAAGAAAGEQPGRHEHHRGAEEAPRPVTVQQFQGDGAQLASEGVRVLVSGAYLRAGGDAYLYASSAAIQTENLTARPAPSVRLLTEHASERARARFIACSADSVAAQDGCAVTIEGMATTCKASYLLGPAREVPCIDVRDIEP